MAKFLQSGQNCPAPGVAQHHDESCAEPLRCELDTADLGRGDDVPGDPDDKQVAQALIEGSLEADRLSVRDPASGGR